MNAEAGNNRSFHPIKIINGVEYSEAGEGAIHIDADHVAVLGFARGADTGFIEDELGKTIYTTNTEGGMRLHQIAPVVFGETLLVFLRYGNEDAWGGSNE